MRRSRKRRRETATVSGYSTVMFLRQTVKIARCCAGIRVALMLFAATITGVEAQTTSAPKAGVWKIYTNARYGYVAPYPATLYPQGEADNGDGQIFLSRDARVKLTVFASHNALNETLDSRYARDSRGGLPGDPKRVVTYHARKANWYAVSGTRSGAVFYQKTHLVGDTFSTWEITYPESQKASWNPVVTRINAGFHTAKPPL